MNIKELRSLADGLPTVLSLDDEVHLIDELTSISVGDLRADEGDFRAIATKIQESHHGNGVFEVTEENHHIFKAYCEWLRRLQSVLDFDVLGFCDGLDAEPADIRKAFAKPSGS